MTENEWTAIMACICAAENSDSSHTLAQVEIAREWLMQQEWEDEPECDPHNGVCVDEGNCGFCSSYWTEFHAEGMREDYSLAEPGSRVDMGLPAYNRESYFR